MVDHIEKLSSKRWNERRDALDKIDSKLRSGTCMLVEASDLVNAVIKVLSTDKHLQLVATAANIITRAANTMKQDFALLSKPTLLACLSGFRINKSFVICALRSAADATFNTLSIETITEAVLAVLAEKTSNPSMKEEALSLLGRALQASEANTSVVARRNLFRRLLSPLIVLMEARSDGTRDAACHTLATARRFLADETAYARLTNDVDDSKKARIDIVYQRLSDSIKKVEHRSNSEAISKANTIDAEAQASSLDKATSKWQPTSRAFVPLHSQSKRTRGNSRAPSAVRHSDSFAAELQMPEEEVKHVLVQRSISENTIDNLSSSNWRERLESINRLYSAMSSLSFDSPAFSQSLIRLILRAPGFKESNVQVKCRLLETIGVILDSSKTSFLSEALFQTLTTNLVDLICTPKSASSCEVCLNGLERCCGLPVLGDTLLRLAATSKMPKSTEHIVLWVMRAIEHSGDFCLNYSLTVRHLKEGFNSSSGPVRHAYVKLAGAIYMALGGNECDFNDGDLGTSCAAAFRADIENSSKPAIVALLHDEFHTRQNAPMTATSETPRHNALQKSSPSLSGVNRTPVMTPRRMNTVLNTPSEALQRSICYGVDKEERSGVEADTGNSFVLEHQPPLSLSSTFSAISIPLLVADFRAKKTRLTQFTTGALRPTRQRLEGDFMDAGMHPNLRRLLLSWDTDPSKTKEALILLTHLLLQRMSPRHNSAEHPQDLLSDTLSNSDLIFQWMAESCFVPDTFDSDVVSQALEYLGEFIARLADAKMTLTPAEVRILLPWPLFAPHLLDRYFSQSPERCRRLTSLLFSLCRVLSADEVYCTVMEAISTITETEILKELLHLVKLLLVRFPSLPNPSVADIKAIAQHIGSPDKEVHRAALECLKATRGTYSTEQISTMAGKLTERDRVFLEEVLNQDVSVSTFQTPLRSKTPHVECVFSAPYTNNPSILASITRSHLVQRPHLAGLEDDESRLRTYRRWILGVLAEDDRNKETRMVEFLISKLLTTAPPPSSQGAAEHLDAALLAISHLDFLHQSTATRDLLLPEAPTLIEHLGLQLTHLALASVPPLDYATEEACRFVRATVGLVISIFRASFLTRDLPHQSLSQLLGGLLRLHAVLDHICQGQFEGLNLTHSLLFRLTELDVARLLEEELLLSLEYIHEKLVANSLCTYVIALTNLISGQWSGDEAGESDVKGGLLAHNNLLLHMLDLATKKLNETKDDQRGRVNEVQKALENALERSHSSHQRSACNDDLLMLAFSLNRLRC